MLHEKSCGAVVFRRDGSETYVLLIRHKKGGHRSFPKGHVERGESERRTAEREVREETGAVITIRERFRVPIRYCPMPRRGEGSRLLSGLHRRPDHPPPPGGDRRGRMDVGRCSRKCTVSR